MNKFVDTNVAHHCLKLLVTILNAMTRDGANKLTKGDKQFFITVLESNDGSLVRGLMRYKKESQDDRKMVKLLDHILSRMGILCSNDSLVSTLIKTTTTSNETEHQPSIDSQLKKQNEQKADKMKKKQNKLLLKMKNKGKKLLQTQKEKIDDENAKN